MTAREALTALKNVTMETAQLKKHKNILRIQKTYCTFATAFEKAPNVEEERRWFPLCMKQALLDHYRLT